MTKHALSDRPRGGPDGPASALAILPTGTANNVARSFGLSSIRPARGVGALELAMSVALEGAERTIDLGSANGRHFVNAFAVGFDADILATRNLLRQRNRLAWRFDGYPLYLWSSAVNVTHNHHGAGMRLRHDGEMRQGYAYNLLFTNTPLYGGGFRIDDDTAAENGLLDLQVFGGPLDYLRLIPAAWMQERQRSRRHILPQSDGLRRVRQATIELDAPVRGQLDGEKIGRQVSCDVRVVPQAIRVRVPATLARGRS